MNVGRRRYLALRVAQVLPTAAGIVLVGFALLHLAPGDPVLALAGDSGDEAYYARVRERFGLDRPLPVQLAAYARAVASGDLGTSFVQGRPVLELILERLPATLLLAGTALLLSTIVGLLVGVGAAVRRGRPTDRLLTSVTLALYAAPVFWVGQLAILGFSLGLGWFPVQGMTDPRRTLTGWAAAVDVAHHLALPAAVLASQQLAAVARLTRAGLVDELGSDHVRTARAKGVREPVVVVRHALRRPMLPVLTVIGGRVGHLVAGTVIVETVFGWPGIGRLLLGAIQARDIPVVLGVFLMVGFTVALANLVTDLSYARLDPRVRYR
jgi:peptide/nickel transport system permease protein